MPVQRLEDPIEERGRRVEPRVADARAARVRAEVQVPGLPTDVAHLMVHLVGLEHAPQGSEHDMEATPAEGLQAVTVADFGSSPSAAQRSATTTPSGAVARSSTMNRPVGDRDIHRFAQRSTSTT